MRSWWMIESVDSFKVYQLHRKNGAFSLVIDGLGVTSVSSVSRALSLTVACASKDAARN